MTDDLSKDPEIVYEAFWSQERVLGVSFALFIQVI